MQKVFGLVSDGGDGSSSILWFLDEKVVDNLLNDDSEYTEQFYGNEGSPAETLTFPDDLNLVTVGFTFSDDWFPVNSEDEKVEDPEDENG